LGSSGVTPTNLTATASATFFYTYSANASGSASVAVSSTATDANSGALVGSALANSGAITVQNPVSLTASLVVAPGSSLVGGLFTALLTVANANGSAAATALTPPASPVFSNPASVSLVAGPLPPAPATLVGGASTTFTYVLGAVAQDPLVDISLTVTAADGNGGLPASQPVVSNNFNVVSSSPILTSSYWLTPTPLVATRGQAVTAVLAVVNSNALVNAYNVTATSVGTTGLVGTQLGAVVPASIGTLAPGATGYFTYRFSFAASGTAGFSASASSLSATSGVIATGLTVTVQSAPSLAVSSITLSPTTVSLGQAYTLVVSISNGGEATAVNVAPFSLNKQGTANPNALSAPTPASATVVAGATASFTYTGTATLAGAGLSPWSLGYLGSAQGNDLNSGATIFSGSAASATITVNTPAQLATAISVTRTQLNMGQTVQISLTVTNTGDAAANGVLPVAVDQLGTGGFNLVAPFSQTPVNLTKGTATTFNWTYSAIGTGTVSFSSSASALDGNSGAPVVSAPVNTGSLLVQLPTILQVTGISALPSVQGTGAPITVVMTLANTGQATALNVSGDATLGVNGPGSATYASGPSPALLPSLAGGASADFTYIYTATAPTTVSFSGVAYGMDVNDGVTQTSAPATSGNVTINNAATLLAGVILLPPAQITRGNIITVVLTVNGGQMEFR
jgi:hypothetical protein